MDVHASLVDGVIVFVPACYGPLRHRIRPLEVNPVSKTLRFPKIESVLDLESKHLGLVDDAVTDVENEALARITGVDEKLSEEPAIDVASLDVSIPPVVDLRSPDSGKFHCLPNLVHTGGDNELCAVDSAVIETDIP